MDLGFVNGGLTLPHLIWVRLGGTAGIPAGMLYVPNLMMKELAS
ncbi:hypothetical protein [Peribacillus butanolivorans]